MARQKKNGTYLNVCIDSEIYEQLSQFCDKAGQTKTVASTLKNIQENNECSKNWNKVIFSARRN